MSQNLSLAVIGEIRQVLQPDFREIRGNVASEKQDIVEISKSLDGLFQMVRRHDQKFVVLRAQHDEKHEALVKKGVAT